MEADKELALYETSSPINTEPWSVNNKARVL